jgi:hypothetical protein
MFYIKRNPSLERIDIQSIYLMHKNKELDESPYYQRFNDLWSIEKKRLLLDTIINGYDIPKFYFHYIISNENTLNQTNKKYAIIDGKQRLNTLVEFFENELALDETVKWLDNPDILLKGVRYKDLSIRKELVELKSKIDNYQLDIIHVTTDEFDRIEEMFLRLNEGVPVNNAEKRNSIGGYLIEGINKLVKTSDFFVNKVRFSNKRMEHQDLVTKLSLIEDSTLLESFTKRNLDNLVKKYKPKQKATDNEKKKLKKDANDLLKNVEYGLQNLNGVFGNNDELLRYKGILPLYYLFMKNNIKTSKSKIRDFIKNFEEARAKNRKIGLSEKPNSTLLQFDRLNQQGAHQVNSLNNRLKIMYFYWTNGGSNFRKEMKPSEIGIESDEE